MAMVKDVILPMSELRQATNNFSKKNLMKQTPSVVLYKGQLDQSGKSIPIVARRYTNPYVSFNEVWIALYHYHKNIATIFKVASGNLPDDKDDFDELDKDTKRKVLSTGYLIYKYEVNGSLDKHLSGSTLTWMQRLHISVDVAHVLCFFHHELPDDDSMIHGNIKSSKILLNQNWEPTLHGLRYDMLVKKHGVHHPSNYDGALQYTDPAYEKTEALSHKSDVYSFGVVLFEVLLGRVASTPISDDNNCSFARFAHSHYELKTLNDVIDPVLRQQMDSQSFKNFSETAYYCLQELPSQRPDMNQVIKKLERALDLQQKHESPEHSTTSPVEAPISAQLKGKNLDRLRISLSEIRLATDNFSKTCRIGSGGYGRVYRAELHHFDRSYSSTTEGMVKDDLPKRKSTVAVKCISNRVDKQGARGFLAEIEMLSNCKHPNVVSLYGFCHEGNEMILVYEHISNGSLDNYLGDHDKLINLTWAQRMQIGLDVAQGIYYLHTSTKDKPTILHRDVKSANILLDDNWVAKIGDFGLSKLNNTNQQSRTLLTSTIAGTEVYLDPEYARTGKLNKKSDIYSFGVVLFEIMCGRLAYDNTYHVDNDKGLPSVIRRRFNDGTLKEMVDPKIMGTDESMFTLDGGLNHESLDTFLKIAYQCLEETQAKRPTMKVVIKELENAIHFQKKNKDNLHILLEDIESATQNFSDDKCIEEGRYWKQYEGQIPLANANEHTTVVVKRFDKKSAEGREQFLTEMKVLVEFKHKNIIALVGYCTEMDERIICYEHAPNGRLNKYVEDASLSWMQRIKICLDVATGLTFLHKGGGGINMMVHSDIKSRSILLDAEWNAKISNLELASRYLNFEQWKHDGNDYGSFDFKDPERRDYATEESDWYSFSRILLDVFCGEYIKYSWSTYRHMLYGRFDGQLGPWTVLTGFFAACASTEVFINRVASEAIKEQISAKSCEIFFKVGFQCGQDKDGRRVIERLEKALEAQEDHEIWEPKLPRDYQEILESSKMENNHEILDSSKIEVRMDSKKRCYELLCKGILLKEGTTWVSLGSNRRINEMISARKFVFKKSGLRSWRSTPESRFPKVAEMFIISNLKIKINIRTQFLSLGVNYGVHLVFKFCGPKKSLSKPSYVNLTYKMGKETLHAYFATWRDEDWMMIELGRFLNHKKDTNFEVLLESFSLYYCGRNVIYIEGIEFRAISDVNNEESVKIEEVQQILESNTEMVQVQQQATHSEEICNRSSNDEESEKVLSLNEVNEKKHLMLSAKDILHDTSVVKHFYLKPSEEPRFQEVIELFPQQVFSIKCKIQSQMLLPDTDYMCYLVFKLAEKCHGLHCPVKVRDVLHWKNKEIGILYFRTPDPWNIHDHYRIPEKREDGWMEVIVWKFNSTSELRNDYIPMHLKLIAYEGTMSGLIVGGLEVRPI